MKNIRGRKSRNKRRLILICKIVICLAVCVGAIFGLKAAAETVLQEETKITLKPAEMEMRIGESIPKIKANIKVEGEQDIVLDKKSGKTVEDLATELKRGENYTVICQANGKTEGSFPIKIVLQKDLEKKLQKEWKGKVSVRTETATLLVKEALHKGPDPSKPMLALTFDDGPGVEAGRILDVLEQYDAKATFFMVGPMVNRHPETVRRIAELNCELGNHSTNHPKLTRMDAAGIQKEIQTTTDAIAKATGGKKPTVMRPPFGAVNETVKQTVGLPIIMWSVDTLDWKTRNTQATIDSVLKNAKDGSIILMHDIHKPSVDAAVQLIPKLIEKGYQLVTVSELAQARGIQLENGVKYAQFYR